LTEILLKPISASTLFESMLRVIHSPDAARPYPHATAGRATDFSKLTALRGADILLVEDNALNQQVASELLQLAGFHVDIADNGQIALDRVAAKRYDLVLMDMQMPVMDGLTATTHLRADLRNKDLPIIAMTANAMQADRDRCMAVGMNGFVTKPIEPEQLEAALLIWIIPRLGLGQADALVPATPNQPQADAQTQNMLSALASVPDLDVQRGLQRMLGNQRLYLQLTQGFCDSQQTAVTEILQGYRRGDMELSERLAHTLKGLSGNIGADAVLTRAGAVEALIHDQANAHEIDAQLEALNGALQSLLKSIHAAIPVFPSSPMDAATDPASIESSLQQLRQLLEEEHADSLSLLRERRETFRAALGENYAPLAAAVEQFDFEMALRALNRSTETV
jgi:two-component system sensor histidine kinase/response regulator